MSDHENCECCLCEKDRVSPPDPNCEYCHGKGICGGCGADDCAEKGHMHTYWFCTCRAEEQTTGIGTGIPPEGP